MVRSALLFGMVNAGVALWSTVLFRAQLLVKPMMLAHDVGVSAADALAGGMAASEWITSVADTNLYADQVILVKGHALSAHRSHALERRSAAIL